jgi:molybdopterin adenylyltransferase
VSTIRAAIVTVSDSVAAGTRQDRSGAVLRDRAEALGWQVTALETVPDEIGRIASVLTRLADSGQVSLVLTTGGTGVALRDVTPEAVRTVIQREIPGLGEMMRAEYSPHHRSNRREDRARQCAKLELCATH